MVDKKLSEFDEVSNGDVSFFPVLDNNTKNGKLAATKAMPWTNCTTEIPQDIKLSLNNGTLTLLAGSKVYIPNGSGVFNAVTTTTDKTISSGLGNGLNFIEIDESNSNLSGRLVENSVSGSGVTTAGGLAYDTTANRVGFYNANGSFSKYVSFPIAIVNVESSVITSIVQVFNGFGYIGSTVFVLPSAKGLAPNGRNADGTLKSNEIISSRVIVRTFTTYSDIHDLSFTATGIGLNRNTYNEEENFVYNSGGQTVTDRVIFGKLEYERTSPYKVISLNVKPTFHAVDYSEFKEMISAIDQDTMKLSGNQEVDGVKTFLQNPYFTTQSSTGGRYICKSTVLDLTDTTRTNDIRIGYRTLDKNNNIAGEFSTSFSTTGTSVGTMQVRNRASGSQVTAQIQVIIDKNGNISTSCPTPSSVTDNSTKIATTQWFNNKVKQVSTLPANPTAGVYYFVTE